MVTGGLTAIDVKDLSGHEPRRFQVHDRVHDVRHFSHSAEGMMFSRAVAHNPAAVAANSQTARDL
jgi:hypothetical protein